MDNRIAVCRHQHAREHIDGSSLASTVMAKKRDNLTFFDAERKIVNRSELTKILRHAPKLDWIGVVEGLFRLTLATFYALTFILLAVVI